MILLFYNIIIFLLLPIWLLLLIKKEGIYHFHQRFGLYRKRNDRPVWIHSVSLGEGKLAILLIEKFKKEKIPLFITTTTRSGYLHFKKNNIECSYFPIDFYLFMKVALQRIKPSSIIIIETEIWPNFLYLSKLKKIKTFIVNGRISDSNYKKIRALKLIIDKVISNIFVVTYSETYKKRFEEIGVSNEKIFLTRNLKFDLLKVDEKVLKSKLEDFDRLIYKDKIVVAGSIRKGEEETILYAFKEIKNHFPEILLIIAPRHLIRVKIIEKICERLNLTYSRRSTKIYNKEDVLILDTYGELSFIYGKALVAIIGGAFLKYGGQNPVEPYLFKVPVIIGKYYYNFKEEVELLLKNNLILIAENKYELKEKLLYLLKNEEIRVKMGEMGNKIVLEQRGAIDETFEILKEKMCYLFNG